MLRRADEKPATDHPKRRARHRDAAGRDVAVSDAAMTLADRGVRGSLSVAGGPDTARKPELRAGALILHDDEATLDLVRTMVEGTGFDTVCPKSLFELLTVEPATAPRLLVLGMTAVEDRDLEIVEHLRRRWPEAWILALHPASLRERATKALDLGADGSLPEPFYASEIAALSRRALARTAAATVPDAPPRAEPVAAPASDVPPVPVSPAERPPASGEPAVAVARLAVGVAHSIRKSMEILDHQLDAAETEGDVDVPALRTQLRRIALVAEELTRFAGPPGLALRPVDLTTLVTSVFVSRDVGAAGAEIGVRIGEARVEILAVSDLLRAGLESLRNRAVRVTPPEGKISVRTRNRTENGSRRVEISVTDGGPALSDEHRASLFDPFPEEGSVEDGTGLELAALAGIVRAHGGTLLALAAGATGTIVVIRLPVSDPAAKDASGTRS